MPEHSFDRSYELHERASAVIAGGVSTAFRAFERPVPLSLRVRSGRAAGRRRRQRARRLRLRHGPDHPRPRARASGRGRDAGGVAAAAAERASTRPRSSWPSCSARSCRAASGCGSACPAPRPCTPRCGSAAPPRAGRWSSSSPATTTAGSTRSSPATSHLPPARPGDGGPAAVGAAGPGRRSSGTTRTGLEQLFAERGAEIAALIMEPYPCNGGVIPGAPGFVERCRELCDTPAACSCSTR